MGDNPPPITLPQKVIAPPDGPPLNPVGMAAGEDPHLPGIPALPDDAPDPSPAASVPPPRYRSTQWVHYTPPGAPPGTPPLPALIFGTSFTPGQPYVYEVQVAGETVARQVAEGDLADYPPTWSAPV